MRAARAPSTTTQPPRGYLARQQENHVQAPFVSVLRSAAFVLTAASAFAQATQYTAQFLGAGSVVVNDMNLSGEIVGWDLRNGVQAFIAGPNHPYEDLPLPPGYQSAWAQGVNDAGVVVGSAAMGSFPEYGQAVAWFPNGQGGYTTQLLGQLPGHVSSVAYDVNNRGDIVGVSLIPGFQGGPTVWFNSPSGLIDISALGAPSGVKEINDQGVLTGINGGLFDVDTLSPSPLPPFPAGWTGFQGWAIAEDGSLAGVGRHGSQRSAAIWTPSLGWQSVSLLYSQSSSVQAYDIDGSTGVVHFDAPAPSAHFVGVGGGSLLSRLSPAQQSQYSFSVAFGGAVNARGDIGVIGSFNGSTGVVILRPDVVAPVEYCVAKTSSAGCVASIGVSSPMQQPMSGAGGYAVIATQVQELKSGLLLGGVAGPAASPFAGGVMCVAPPRRRGPITTSGGDNSSECDGLFSTIVNDGQVFPLGLDAGPGASAWYQYWYRDPLAGSGASGAALSNAIRLDFQ